MKRLIALILPFVLMLSTVSCGQNVSGEHGEEMTGQKEVARIARYDRYLPDDYAWFDYGTVAVGFDDLVFGGRTEGAYFPLLWQDETNGTFGFAAYVVMFQKQV